MDRHTWQQEAINVERAKHLAEVSRRSNQAAVKRDDDRITTLELRLEEIRAQLASSDSTCDCPA